MGGHAPVVVCGNLYVVLTTLTSVLGKGCLHTAILSTTLSFPSLLYTLVDREGPARDEARVGKSLT